MKDLQVPGETQNLKGPQCPTIGTLPVDTAAGKPPQILFHASITNLKTAWADPAKELGLTATTANILLFFSRFFVVLLLNHFKKNSPTPIRLVTIQNHCHLLKGS